MYLLYNFLTSLRLSFNRFIVTTAILVPKIMEAGESPRPCSCGLSPLDLEEDLLSRRFPCCVQQTIDLRLTAKHLRRCFVFESVMLELRVRDLPSESLPARLGVSVECKHHFPLRHVVALRYPTPSS